MLSPLTTKETDSLVELLFDVYVKFHFNDGPHSDTELLSRVNDILNYHMGRDELDKRLRPYKDWED